MHGQRKFDLHSLHNCLEKREPSRKFFDGITGQKRFDGITGQMASQKNTSKVKPNPKICCHIPHCASPGLLLFQPLATVYLYIMQLFCTCFRASVTGEQINAHIQNLQNFLEDRFIKQPDITYSNVLF